MKLDQVIKDYRLTEKANQLNANLNQYTFVVDIRATRSDVARAVAAHFKKKVASVNVMRVRGKAKASRTNRAISGCTSAFKKAIVTLEKGEKIELL